LASARDGSGNSWFRAHMSNAQKAIADGQRVYRAFAELSFLPALVVEFAAVGEETGKLSIMMGEVASILEHDVETRLNRFSALVLPGATLILGALVACIMAGIVSGMLAVNDLVH
jgi:general secretion pathway protein F